MAENDCSRSVSAGKSTPDTICRRDGCGHRKSFHDKTRGPCQIDNCVCDAYVSPRGEYGRGRVWQIGNVWYIQYYANGRQFRASAKTTDRRVAEKLLQRRLGEVAAGLHTGPSRQTYDDLRRAYMNEYVAAKKRSLRWQRDPETGVRHPVLHTVTRLDEFFRGYKVSAIDADAIAEFKTKMQQDGLSDGSINRSLSALRRMFYLAFEDNKLRHVPYIRMLDEPKPRKGTLPDTKYDALMATLPPHVRTPLAIGYHTGMRRGEVLGLRWEQVNFLDAYIRLNDGETKNGEGRVVPIPPDLMAVLHAERVRAEQLRCHTFVSAKNVAVPCRLETSARCCRRPVLSWGLAAWRMSARIGRVLATT